MSLSKFKRHDDSLPQVCRQNCTDQKKQEKISHVHHVLPDLASPKYGTASFLRTSSLPSSTLSFRINRPRTRKNLSGRASTTCTDVAERSIDSAASRARIASCLSLAHLARPPSSGQSMPYIRTAIRAARYTMLRTETL